MNKTNNRAGGLAVKKKYGVKHFKKIGSLGAQSFHRKYKLVPFGLSDFTITDRINGDQVATLSGRHLETLAQKARRYYLKGRKK